MRGSTRQLGSSGSDSPAKAIAVLAVLACYTTSPVIAQQAPVATAIHQEILRTYSFSPHKLSAEQINEKSKILDAFWERAKGQRTAYLPALREELKNFENPRFFLYDGSALLLSMSDTPMDRQIALQAMARCDLRDVRRNDYFRQVHRLATLGEDTTDAAFQILSEPAFTVFIPQHALTLGQNYALVYMLLPTDPSYWIQRAVKRLATESDPAAQRSLLLLLWYAQTKDADSAVSGFSASADKPRASRDYATELLARNKKAGLLAKAVGAFQSEEALRAARRDLMKRVSDEALIELDDKTLLLIAKRQ